MEQKIWNLWVGENSEFYNFDAKLGTIIFNGIHIIGVIKDSF